MKGGLSVKLKPPAAFPLCSLWLAFVFFLGPGKNSLTTERTAECQDPHIAWKDSLWPFQATAQDFQIFTNRLSFCQSGRLNPPGKMP